MKRVLFAGALALLLTVSLTTFVHADKNKGASGVQTMSELPKPADLTIKEGATEGHKQPNEVMALAIKYAKADDNDNLKKCFAPNNRTQLDKDSWNEKEGDKTLTRIQALARELKKYPDGGGATLKQARGGKYAVVVVNVEKLVHMVRVGLTHNWKNAKEPDDWYLTSISAVDYRIDYNAPGLKEVRDAVDSGDKKAMKDHLNQFQTDALDVIDGVEEGVDAYGLLMKRFQKIAKNADKPTILLNYNTDSVAYWFHSDTADTFLVLTFREDMKDWNSNKKYIRVEFDLSSMKQFIQDSQKGYRNWVGDFS